MGTVRGNKRTKSKSPPKVGNSNSKKPKNDSSHTPVQKQSSSSASTSSQVPLNVTSQDPANGKFVKPVFVKSNFQVVKNVLQSVPFTSKPLCKVRGTNSTQVLCFNVEDKKKLINKLQSQNIGFHTFTDAVDKPNYFLMKGFYDASCNDALTALQSSAVPAVKVTDFIRNHNYVFFLVHFDKSVNVQLLNHSHKYVDGIVVKWEVLKKANKKPIQCYRCQSWGHASINCGLPERCVKCSGTHEKGSCPRTSREGDPSCCNCGGSHSSNHRGCPTYKQHLEKIKVRSNRQSPAVIYRSPANENYDSQFPQLGSHAAPTINSQVGNLNFARTLRDPVVSQSNNAFIKLTQAQAKLNSIPNINESINVFVRMVDELSACNDQQGHLNILLKYCSSFNNTSNES